MLYLRTRVMEIYAVLSHGIAKMGYVSAEKAKIKILLRYKEDSAEYESFQQMGDSCPGNWGRRTKEGIKKAGSFHMNCCS